MYSCSATHNEQALWGVECVILGKLSSCVQLQCTSSSVTEPVPPILLGFLNGKGV